MLQNSKLKMKKIIPSTCKFIYSIEGCDYLKDESELEILYQKGLNIEHVKSASFIIPELVDWLGIRTVDLGVTEQENLIAVEAKLPNIILKAENPKIEIYFEAGNSLYNPDIDDRIAFEIRNQPRVRIVYKEPSNVEKLHSDIRAIMQFFGLMIGHITDALDIRLDIQISID